MKNIKTYQEQFIFSAKKELDNLLYEKEIINRNELRLSILEKCASIIGGYNYENYCNLINNKFNEYVAKLDLSTLLTEILKTELPSNIILSILADDEKLDINKKQTGAYYTDFRIAIKLAENFTPLFIDKKKGPKILDPSVGSGMLLNTIAIEFAKHRGIDYILSKCLYGCDLNENAIRGCLLSLSSMTNNLATILNLKSHLHNFDSLTASSEKWKKISDDGFDGIIGNPPWEKIKITRFEFFQTQNSHLTTHYGDTEKEVDEDSLRNFKNKLQDYIKSINHLLPEKGREVDFYAPFLMLADNLVKKNGIVAQLIPASLIRNLSTESLRNSIFTANRNISITLFDNKDRFFAIDSRFKFIILSYTRGKSSSKTFLSFEKYNSNILTPQAVQTIKILISDLTLIKNDLSIPELNNQFEWDIYKNIYLRLPQFGKSKIWNHTFCREIDMTLGKRKFIRHKTSTSVPVLEGRMIHQFKCGIKSYKSGTGRKAIWIENIPTSVENYKAQFYIEIKDIPKARKSKYLSKRVGFCDITGQTNERTMLSTILPSGVLCGNKVPTVDFLNEETLPSLPYIFVAISNSFVYDWLIRKTITTNANFFIVDSIPIPEPIIDNELYERLGKLSKSLDEKSNHYYDWNQAYIRAEIDAIVATLYNLSFEEFLYILQSFNAIDKNKKENEFMYTQTVTIALLKYLQINNINFKLQLELEKDLEKYKNIDAIPYVPFQFSKLVDNKTKNHNERKNQTWNSCKSILS